MQTHDVEVLVAGLGPVGAVAALILAQSGVKVAAIEAHSQPASDLRASTFHAPTIEILHRLGVSQTLLEQGLQAPVYQFRDRQSGEVFAFDLAEIADRTAFPYRIQCEQHRVTREIVDKLATLPDASVRFGAKLLFVEQDGERRHRACRHRHRGRALPRALPGGGRWREQRRAQGARPRLPGVHLRREVSLPLDRAPDRAALSTTSPTSTTCRTPTSGWCCCACRGFGACWCRPARRVHRCRNARLSDANKNADVRSACSVAAILRSRPGTARSTACTSGSASTFALGKRRPGRRCRAPEQPDGRLRHEQRHPRFAVNLCEKLVAILTRQRRRRRPARGSSSGSGAR